MRLTRKIIQTGGLVAYGLVLTAACGGQSTSRTKSTTADDRADAGAVKADTGGGMAGARASALTDASSAGSVDGQTSGSASNTTQATTSGVTSAGGTSAQATASVTSPGSLTTGPSRSGGTTDPAQTSADAGGWTVVESPAYDFSNCQEQRLFGTNSCAYQLLCEEANITTHCDRSADAEWQCYCEDTGAQKLENYTLSNVEDADTACASGIPFCVPGHEPELEVECSLVEREAASTSECRLAHVCVGTGELPDGVTAQQSAVDALRVCQEAALGFDCHCDGTDSPAALIIAPQPNDACMALDDLCTDKLELSDEPYCTEPEYFADELNCNITWACGEHAEPEDGIHVLADAEFPAVSCFQHDGSLYNCNSSANRFVWIGYVEADEPETACQTMLLLDSTEPEIEPTGNVDCPPPTRVYPDTPTAYRAVCSQAVDVVGEGSFILGGELLVQCLPDGDQWQCHCSSNGSDTRFDANGDEPEAVTLAAFDECASRARLSVRDQALGFEFPQ